MTDDGTQDEDDKGARQKQGEGIRSGIGVLSAFKDALEETIQEARDRGDLSTDRAKGVMKEALNKAQTAASGARERLDFVHQAEFEALSATVESLRGEQCFLGFLHAAEALQGEAEVVADPMAGGQPLGRLTQGFRCSGQIVHLRQQEAQ